MPELRVTIEFQVDGDDIAISPIIYTLNVAQEALAQFIQPADGTPNTYHPVTGSVSPVSQALLITADQAYNLKFNNFGALSMNAGGVVLAIGANLTIGAFANIDINIPGATDANVVALTGGT